jgi:hypothetical protein
MTQEIWKDVPGYEGQYQVSDHGRVRSLDRVILCAGAVKGIYPSHKKGRLLRPGPINSGHLSVVLGRGGTKLVHQLVLRAFVGPPPDKHEGCHNNGNPADNRLENLRWGTRRENIKDKTSHGLSKLKPEDVRAIKEALQSNRRGIQAQLARRFGVSESTISDIKTGRTHE